MKDESKSPIFALSKDQKLKALEAIESGIQQLQWQHGFVVKQIEALPEVPEDAPKEEKQARAQRWVQADAIEKKIEDQIEFYNFCKSNI